MTNSQNTDSRQQEITIPQDKSYLRELFESISFAVATECPSAIYHFTNAYLFHLIMGPVFLATKRDYQAPSFSNSLDKLIKGVGFSLAKAVYVGFGKLAYLDLGFNPEYYQNIQYFLGTSGSILRKIARAAIDDEPASYIDLANEGVNGFLYIADVNMTHITEIEALSGLVTLSQSVWKSHHDESPDLYYLLKPLITLEVIKTLTDAKVTQDINDLIYTPYNNALVNLMYQATSLNQTSNSTNVQNAEPVFSDNHRRKPTYDPDDLSSEYSCTSENYFTRYDHSFNNLTLGALNPLEDLG